MNKICGYSCEHNKSGVCQITICDKQSFVTDNTKVFEYTDRYIEKPIDMSNKINELQQENQKLKDRDLIIATELTKLQDECKQLKDNWNKLKSWANYMRVNTLQQNNYGRILDKMQEIEGSDSNVKD